MTNQCKHGQLARVCPLCEKDEQIRVLREALQRYVDHFGDPLQCARAALEATK